MSVVYIPAGWKMVRVYIPASWKMMIIYIPTSQKIIVLYILSGWKMEIAFTPEGVENNNCIFPALPGPATTEEGEKWRNSHKGEQHCVGGRRIVITYLADYSHSCGSVSLSRSLK